MAVELFFAVEAPEFVIQIGPFTIQGVLAQQLQFVGIGQRNVVGRVHVVSPCAGQGCGRTRFWRGSIAG
jgi:hypothetical protein